MKYCLCEAPAREHDVTYERASCYAPAVECEDGNDDVSLDGDFEVTDKVKKNE
jgi:hypothetical protein